MNWRTMTNEQIEQNSMAYWRSKFLEEKRRYPDNTRLELSEYGFTRMLKARRTLDTLAQRELDIKVIKAAMEMTW